jgi:transposase-like protein
VNDQRREHWSKLIAEQEVSGQSIRAFCKKRGIVAHTFYIWRRRLRANEPVQFALLETVANPASDCVLELVMTNGERLRIPNHVDATTLRLVLDAVRR